MADRETNSLGFLPKQRWPEYLAAGQVLAAFENDEPCGYLLRGIWRRDLRIYQACVQLDARRIEHATALVKNLIDHANANAVETITLHCADDLPSNAFWQAAGFTFTGHARRRRKTARLLRRWQLVLPAFSARRERAQHEIQTRGDKNLLDLLGANDNRIRSLANFRDAF